MSIKQSRSVNHMFIGEIWDKLTEFVFLSEVREIQEFQKLYNVNFSQVSQKLTCDFWLITP